MRNIVGTQGGSTISIAVPGVFACPVSVVVHGGVVFVLEFLICAQGVLEERGS